MSASAPPAPSLSSLAASMDRMRALRAAEAALTDEQRSARDHERTARRAAALAALPREAPPETLDRQGLILRLERMALSIGGARARELAQNQPHWWRHADTLDEIMDCLDAARLGDRRPPPPEIAALPRIGTRRVEDRATLVRLLEDLALDAGDELAQARLSASEAAASDMTRRADLLADALACLDAARRGLDA